MNHILKVLLPSLLTLVLWNRSVEPPQAITKLQGRFTELSKLAYERSVSARASLSTMWKFQRADRVVQFKFRSARSQGISVVMRNRIYKHVTPNG